MNIDSDRFEFQTLFIQLQRSLHQAERNPSEFVRSEVGPGLMECWEALRKQGETIQVNDERRGQDVVNAAIRLRLRNLSASLQELQVLGNAAAEQGETKQEKLYQQLTLQHTRALRGLQRLLWQHSRSPHIVETVDV